MAETDDMGSVAAFTNGAGTVEVVVPIREEDLIKEKRPGGWYTKLVAHYLRKSVASRTARGALESAVSPHDLSVSAIRWASVKSAASGALCGSISTAATLITAQTEGLAGIVAGPLAALAIGGEMILRTILHVELTCELAEIFDVEVDVDNPDDLWRLYGLAFKTHGQGDEEDEKGGEDPGKETISEMGHLEGEDIGEKIGSRVLGESVMRNIVPVLGIFTSAVTNYVMTQRLGNTVRRYMRYRHALDAEGSFACEHCHTVLDLVIEGIWFIFSADGKLDPEEITFLDHMLKKLDPVSRKAVTDRFVEDELDWVLRIHKQVPEELRDTFMHVLEVAAAVDKEVGVPERKILRRAAHALGRTWTVDRVKKMIEEFEENGELSAKHAAHGPTPGAAATPTA